MNDFLTSISTCWLSTQAFYPQSGQGIPKIQWRRLYSGSCLLELSRPCSTGFYKRTNADSQVPPTDRSTRYQSFQKRWPLRCLFRAKHGMYIANLWRIFANLFKAGRSWYEWIIHIFCRNEVQESGGEVQGIVAKAGPTRRIGWWLDTVSRSKVIPLTHRISVIWTWLQILAVSPGDSVYGNKCNYETKRKSEDGAENIHCPLQYQ